MHRAQITPDNNVAKYLIKYFVGDVSVGFCSAVVHTNNKAKVMIVDDVLIDEKSRRQGYGTGLMAEVLRFAKEIGVDSVELTVNLENTTARNLYRKIGFEETDKKYCRRILNIK